MPKNLPIELALTITATLEGIEPPIWRTFVVNAADTLDMLHEVLQCLFLWQIEHLHQFRFEGQIYSADAASDDTPGAIEEADTEIGSLLQKRGQKLHYMYDFTEGWKIELKLDDQKDLSTLVHKNLPYCIRGGRAAPPDDCGGPSGYAELLSALREPSKPESVPIIEWLQRPWDPESFDINSTNRMLDIMLGGEDREELDPALEEYLLVVEEQIENADPECVAQTFQRLRREGIPEDEIVSLIGLAFIQERMESNGEAMINEKLYEELLNELPSVPWLTKRM